MTKDVEQSAILQAILELSEQIQENDKKLNARIDQVEVKLTERIDQIEDRLSKQIKKLDEKVGILSLELLETKADVSLLKKIK